MMHNFMHHNCIMPVQQANLKYEKDYILIEILHYINFVRKKDNLNTVVLVVALLYSGQHVLHYITITKHLFGTLNSFLYLCDLIKHNEI